MTYTRQEFFERLKGNNISEPFFLFAGKGYVPGQSNFTIYEEFDNLTEFLQHRQSHIESGLNVLSCAF
jgi:hypothetical protein